jgi:hypothetical protein
MERIPVAALATVVIALAAAPAAGARDFGANLNRTPNNTVGCQGLQFFIRVPSCSFTTSGAIFNSREAMVVPGTGTITKVKIRVGNTTGPMRIAILQSLRKENSGEAACCIGRRQSRVFTPRRNRTTTVTVNLPVSVTFNKHSRIYAFDSMFLTMENPFTPIPANVSNSDNGNVSGGWFPAVRPGQENFGGPYGVGATILIRGTWVKKRR